MTLSTEESAEDSGCSSEISVSRAPPKIVLHTVGGTEALCKSLFCLQVCCQEANMFLEVG